MIEEKINKKNMMWALKETIAMIVWHLEPMMDTGLKNPICLYVLTFRGLLGIIKCNSENSEIGVKIRRFGFTEFF